MTTGTGMDGYFTGADYPCQLVPQMTPAHVVAAASWQGIRGPELCRPFRMLDIGCGGGAALVLAAASHPSGRFEGIDGMESHIVAARDLAEGLPNITFHHATFEQALDGARPDCDLIAMHGVLTWAGPKARYQAMDLAARRLKPGGLLAASYNALPGRARHLAVRHLLRQFAPDSPGTPAEQFRAAFDRVREMADARFDAVSREMLRALTDLAREAPTEYFLHEFMHGDWTPFWASEIGDAFGERGLERVGTVEFLRLRPDLCLTFPQARFAEGIGARHRDLMLDIGMDVVFRTDLIARKPVRGDPAALRRDVWLGAEAEPGARLEIDTPTGPAEVDRAVADAVLEALQIRPRRLGDLLEALDHDADGVVGTVECLLIGQHLLALGPPADAAALAPARRLNARLCDAALNGGGVPIAAMAGAHGPAFVPEVRMGVFPLDPETMLARAAADPDFRARFLSADADPGDRRVRAVIAAGLREVQGRCARLGVPAPS